MNIGVFMLYTKEFDEVAAITVPAWQRYCARHGYDLTVHRGGFDDRTRQLGFQKTDLALHLLHGTDALLVVDCDVLVTNHTVKLETLMNGDHSMFATHDVNGFNAGVYLIRNRGEAIVFLHNVLFYSGRPHSFGEQDAMRDIFLSERYDGFCKILPQSSMNSYFYEEYGGVIRTHNEGQWIQGDFLLHLPGMDNKRRVQHLNWTLDGLLK